MEYTTSRKYGLPNFENFDITALKPTEDPVKQLLELDKIAEKYRDKLNKCCDSYPSCSCQRPIKQGEKVPKKTFPF